MHSGDLFVLKGPQIQSLLLGQELKLLDVVRRAYQLHDTGSETSLPQSVFLRFPGTSENRIIALPAYLGGEFSIAGVKWISSFPSNIAVGMDRASGVLVLSSARTGTPVALLEGSVISAK